MTTRLRSRAVPRSWLSLPLESSPATAATSNPFARKALTYAQLMYSSDKKGSRQISPFYFVRCLRAFPQLLGQLHTAAPLSFNLNDIIVVVRERFVDLGDARLQLVRHCRRLLAAIEDEFGGLEDVIRRPSRRGFPHITSSAATTDTFRVSACFGIYSAFGRLYSHELSHSVKQTGGLAHPFLVGMSGRDSLEPLQQC
jgi:hypothetical protein